MNTEQKLIELKLEMKGNIGISKKRFTLTFDEPFINNEETLMFRITSDVKEEGENIWYECELVQDEEE